MVTSITFFVVILNSGGRVIMFEDSWYSADERYILSRQELLWPQNASILVGMKIHQINEGNRLAWQGCLADSSKTAPRILKFSIAMGADY